VDEVREYLDGGRLSGAVRSQEPDRGPLLDVEAEVVDCADRAEVLGEVLDVDDTLGRHFASPQ